MKTSAPNSLRLLLVVAVLLAVGLTTLALAQQSPIQNGSFVTDWSSQRQVFSDPGTEQDAWANGTHDRWLLIVNNPRYVLQQLHRHAPAQGPAAAYVDALEKVAQANASDAAGQMPPSKNNGKLKKDWSQALLKGAVLPNAYPATYAVNYGTPNCAGDYAFYPTGSTGSSTAATVVAYNNLYDTTCTGTVPSTYWAYNTGAYAVTTSPVISPDGTKVAFVQSTSSNGFQLVVIKWNRGLGANRFYNLPCSYTTGSTVLMCNGAGFNSTDAGSQITSNLSGIPAGDTIASQVNGFELTLATAATATQTNANITLYAQTAAVPGTPALATNITTCTAPCMTVTAINSNADTFSSPYYDISSDTLYVGNDIGHLYKASGVFNGTTNPSIASVTLSFTSIYRAASPIYDNVSGCVFVGDSQGYFYKVNSGIPGTICTSTSFSINAISMLLGESANYQYQGIFDAPLVDSTQGTTYAFVTASAALGTGTGFICYTGSNCIVQYKTNFTGSSALPNSSVGLNPGGVNYLWFDGAFDNVYYSSNNGTGHLWTVSGTEPAGVTGTDIYLMQASISNSSLLNTAGFITDLRVQTPWASSITEFCNNGASPCVVSGGQTTQGNDFIFLSAWADLLTQSGGAACSHSNGTYCVLTFVVNNPGLNNILPVSDLALTRPPCYGTGGFVIDNASTATGASNVYFVNMNGNSNAAASSSVCNIVTSNTIQAVQAGQH